MSLAKIPVCAKSAYYATQSHCYVINSLGSSRESDLRNVIIGNGQIITERGRRREGRGEGEKGGEKRGREEGRGGGRRREGRGEGEKEG